MSATDQSAPKALLLQWKWTIVGAVVFLAAIVGYRMWTDAVAEGPIAEPYRLFIEHLASTSSDAKAALDQYKAKHTRQTVAAEHYILLCAYMVRAAKAQGAKPEEYSEALARGCEQMGRGVEAIP